MKRAPEPNASIETKAPPSRQTLRGLDWLNFLLADVQTGVGPFLAIYLAGYKWNEESVGLARTVGGIAGILTQTPAGGLVDHVHSKLALIAFGILPVRAVLYTLTANKALLVAIQVMDGIVAAIFAVVFVLIIADLTRGACRFNLTLGAINTAVGIGAALSQVIAGSIVHHAGYSAGFLFLAGVALAAFAILYLLMPETLNARLESA